MRTGMSARCDLHVSPDPGRFGISEPAAVAVGAASPPPGFVVVVGGVAFDVEHPGALELHGPAAHGAGAHAEPASEHDLARVCVLAALAETVEHVGQTTGARRAADAQRMRQQPNAAAAVRPHVGTVASRLASSVGSAWRVSPADDVPAVMPPHLRRCRCIEIASPTPGLLAR